MHLVTGNWEAAARAFEGALATLAPEQRGQMYLMLGAVLSKAGHWDRALRALEDARRFPDASKEAQEWICSLTESTDQPRSCPRLK